MFMAREMYVFFIIYISKIDELYCKVEFATSSPSAFRHHKIATLQILLQLK